MERIINLVLIGILLVCAWSGYKKGIIMGIGGIVAIIVALYGANLVATTFSYDIISAMRPFATGYMESQMRREDSGGATISLGIDEEEEEEDSILEQRGWEGSELSVEDLLSEHPESRGAFCIACYEKLGLNEETSQVMAAEAIAYADENETDMISSVVQVLCENICFVGCFLLAFLLIIILLTVIGNLPNLSYKLPHLDLLNDIGGTLLGIVTGLMFCVVLVWALKFTGIVIGRDTLASARVARLFLEHNFLTTRLGL